MLDRYLETEQAREDVRALLDGREEFVGPGGLCIIAGPEGKWRAVTVLDDAGDEVLARVYYRPDGDSYVVTDLGDGVRALRLRGCALLDINPKVDEVLMQMHQAGLLHASYGPVALIHGEIGTIGKVTAADLPDAICRVMLASLRVAQS